MDNQPQQQQQPRHCIIPIHKPSLKEYIFFFVTGMVVSIPFAAFFESLYPFATALLIVLVAPLIEELAKVFPLFYRHGETERSLVTLGLLIGLGFGVIELIEYTVIGGVPFFVRIPGVIFHASSATITSYGIAKKNPLPYYLIAVSLHMVNNFFALNPDILSVFVQLLVLIVVYWLAWRFWHKARTDVVVV